MAIPVWIVACSVACLYGFFKEMRPSEPYLTPYLLGPDKNLTEDAVNSQIYPVWTYSYLVALVPVFLLTDLMRYKPVILFEAASYIVTWIILLFGKTVLDMQFMQFTYGLATATEVAYYSYIYAVVEPERYRQVTSYTRSAVLSGRCVSAVISQILISTNATSYKGLTWISLGGVCIASIVSIFLPAVTRSVYFHHTRTQSQQSVPEEFPADTVQIVSTETSPSVLEGITVNGRPEVSPDQELPSESQNLTRRTKSGYIRRAKAATKNCFVNNFGPIFEDFKNSYSNKHLLKWSIWWAIATCGYLQVGNYVQNLWDSIYPSRQHKDLYNGGVEAAATFLGALVAFLLSFWKVNWRVFGELLLGMVSIIDAVLLISMSFSKTIWIAYIFYVLFRVSYQMVITIASFQIATQMTIERYALVFGCNTFLALLLQTIFTAIVVDKSGLHVSVNIQFIINGSYYLLMGLIFLVMGVYGIRQIGWRMAWRIRRGEPYVELDG